MLLESTAAMNIKETKGRSAACIPHASRCEASSCLHHFMMAAPKNCLERLAHTSTLPIPLSPPVLTVYTDIALKHASLVCVRLRHILQT
jgi:hypothetical protein